jgi:multidrug efflux system outer membrane protein
MLVLGGCATLAPRYERPASPVSTQWPAPDGGGVPASSNAPGAAELDWREFFTDANLRGVIEVALTNNCDLRLAALTVERARALYGIQRAELLPVVNAGAVGSQQQVPADLSSSGERMTTERYDVNLGTVAWEVDFFGRIRSLKDRALEQYLATEQARRGTQILLVSSVASAYLTLAADQEKRTLAQTTLEAQQGSYAMIHRNYELGLVPETDLQRARTQVESARRDVARFAQVVAQDRNALVLLAGGPLPEAQVPRELADVDLPPLIGAGVPSDVLLRRPDVLQAEHLLKAAQADIGAARAAFFPRVALTASSGSASSELSGLFDPGSGTWLFAPQVVMPIFDARTWSAYQGAKVQSEIALTQYQKAIQAAFRDVADALAVSGGVDEEVAAQEAFVNAVAETYRLSQVRYTGGIDSYLDVLDAQRSLYASQQILVSLRLARAVNRVRLYAVLGGGVDVAGAAKDR